MATRYPNACCLRAVTATLLSGARCERSTRATPPTMLGLWSQGTLGLREMGATAPGSASYARGEPRGKGR